MDMSNKNFHNLDSLQHIKTYHVGAIESAAHRSLRQYKDGLLKPYGITGIEWYIIGAVNDAGSDGIRITDLASLIGTTLGFLTKTVNLLEAKGILIRKANAKDARSNYVVLHKDYQAKCVEIEADLRQHLRDTVYGQISPEELLTYIKVMEGFTRIK